MYMNLKESETPNPLSVLITGIKGDHIEIYLIAYIHAIITVFF